MSILQNNDKIKNMDLKAKNKIIANLFLLFAFLIFLASYLIRVDNIWVFILQRASAAALIGGIADWFAVTALFKYPLGFHIPHTNTIKNNKEKIINAISNTVNDVWLGKNYLAKEINGINFSDILLNIIKKDKNKNKLMLSLRKLILKFFNFAKTDNFNNILNKNIDKALDKTLSDDSISKNIISKLALFFKSEDSDYIYGNLINYIGVYIKTYNMDALSKKITETYSDEIIKSIIFAIISLESLSMSMIFVFSATNISMFFTAEPLLYFSIISAICCFKYGLFSSMFKIAKPLKLDIM